jgi:hypothetical protein
VLARLSNSVGELAMQAALRLDPGEFNALVAQFCALPAQT